MTYTNSFLVSYTKLSPNHSGQRTHIIDRITTHCVVGQLSCESICGCFTSPSRQASCNYGIGKDDRISLCVEEKNRSLCSSSNANDQRAVTIECASDMSEPYAMNNAVYDSLVKKLRATVAELTDFIETAEQKSADVTAFIQVVQKYEHITELTPEIMHELIEKIVIHAPDKSSGHRTQEIEIHYRFDVAVTTAVADSMKYDKKRKVA